MFIFVQLEIRGGDEREKTLYVTACLTLGPISNKDRKAKHGTKML